MKRPFYGREGSDQPYLLPITNRELAVARLKCLLKKFRRSPPEQQYEYWYRKAMQKNFNEGYACRGFYEEDVG